MNRILFVCHGNPIYPPAKRCLSQHGVWFDPSKTARTVTRADYDRFDRIICMDSANLRRLHNIIGEDPQKKVHLLLSYTGTGRDVADPWYTGDFERTFQDILEGCEAMIFSGGKTDSPAIFNIGCNFEYCRYISTFVPTYF